MHKIINKKSIQKITAIIIIMINEKMSIENVNKEKIC